MGHFMFNLWLIASLKDDSSVNMVWNIMVDLWHKDPFFLVLAHEYGEALDGYGDITRAHIQLHWA